jgi:DNA-binding MarR family transcriptional regulator
MEQINIGKFIGILNRQFQMYINTALNDIDLSFSEYIFLVNLYDNEGINQEELSSVLFINKSATARAMKILEEKQFLIRKTCDKDKRAKRLYLTDKGRKSKKDICSLLENWMNLITNGMNGETIDIVANGLQFMAEKTRDPDYMNY